MTVMSGRHVADRVLNGMAAVAVLLPTLALPAVVGLDLVDRGRRRVARSGSDTGQSILEWVLIAAVVITIAGIVGVVMITKLGDKSRDLDLTTP